MAERQRHRGRYLVRSNDPEIAEFDESRRRELRRTLGGLLKQFGYRAVKEELLAVKREAASSTVAKASNECRIEAEQDADRALYLALWLEVEVTRQKMSSPLTAEAACGCLAKRGGFIVAEPGILILGLGPNIEKRIRNAATIYRVYKDAEQLRNSSPLLDSAWRDSLADLTGQPRPSAAGNGSAPLWFRFGGKTDEK